MNQLGKEHYFGSGGQTELHPAALVVLLLAIVLMWALPRKYACLPFLVASLLMPFGQQLVVGTLHFPLMRLLLIVAWIRLLMLKNQSGKSGFRWTPVDKLFVAYCLTYTVTYFFLWGEIGALINRFGFLYNAFGVYFFMRYFIRDEKDLDAVAKTFAYVAIVVAGFMIAEQMTHRNVFAIFGGVNPITEVRGDKLRAQGPFAHPLTAGSMGATWFPLVFGLWWIGVKKYKTIAFFGSLGALVVALAANSSTPVLALAAGMFAFFMWPFRRYLRLMRWGIVAVLVGLHLSMKAPVWALISRIDLTGSSSSYHRFELVNQTILRVGEWWMFGTRGTASWGWDMWDTANFYVENAVQGGIFTLGLWIALIAVGFQQLGIARKLHAKSPFQAKRIWVLGCMLFAHAVAFFGISYFDQTSVAWYTGLAMIATAISMRPAKPPAKKTKETEPTSDTALPPESPFEVVPL